MNTRRTGATRPEGQQIVGEKKRETRATDLRNTNERQKQQQGD